MQTVTQTTGTVQLPEAPCSVNAFFYVGDSPDRLQATGRGWTPQEAASNLAETIAATRAALAPPAPLTREARIAQLLTCGLTKALATEDHGLIERLAKAAALVLGDKVALGNRPGMLAVWSQSNADTFYEVDGKLCTCPDSQHHPERLCKHALAAALWQRLEK